MTKKTETNARPDNSEHSPHRLRLPGFISDEEIGLGDVIQPCAGCGRRADALNRWLVFTNRQSK